MHQIGSRRLALTRMVGTGQAPQGYHEGQVFDVDDLDEGTVEDLERKGWARRLDPLDDPGRDKVSIAQAMVRGDALTDPHDRQVAESIGTHDDALAIIHTEDPDATVKDYDDEVEKGSGRNPLGQTLTDAEKEMAASLQRETASLVAGGNRFGNTAPAKSGRGKSGGAGKSQEEQGDARTSGGSGSGSGGSGGSNGPNATDDAAALAKEKGIDLSSVTGTGAEGRITKADVEKAASSQSS